ncbi:MAG: hypothetical protein M3253_03995, partial [Chloroflexota bacterium]|nr:hypothetical protein [Chloroflexota bacterium]
GWYGLAGNSSYTGVFAGFPDPVEGSATDPYLMFAIPSNVYADPCRFLDAGLLTPRVGHSVDDLVNALVALEGAEVSTPTDVTLDGYRGRQLTITAPDTFDECSPEEPQYRLWRFPNGGDHFMAPRQVHRISIIDVDRTRVVIVTSEHPDTAPHDLAQLQQIFESIELEPRY